MINNLYIFTSNSYVVADEWNSNFTAIDDSNNSCTSAITDANAAIAFPDSDLTTLYGVIGSSQNSLAIPGNSITISPQFEYYKTLANGTDLAITIPTGFSSESRIAIKILDNRTLLPFSVSYSGNLITSYENAEIFMAGIYYLMIYEVNGTAIVKLIWTGV